MVMDYGWAEVQTWGISTPFSEMYSKYIATLVTSFISEMSEKKI